MTVYIDEIFIVNLLMDWLILWSVSHLTQQRERRWRLWLAALFGAIYSAAIFFPEMYWLNLPTVKIAWSLLMLLIAFSFFSWKHYLKLVTYFYLCAFVLGGASMAAMSMFGQSTRAVWSGVVLMEIDFRLFWLIAGTGIVFAAMYCLRNRLRNDLSATQQIITASMQFDGRDISLQLLVDSGHSLTDPLTGQSILVAEQSRLLPLYSDDVQALLRQFGSPEATHLLALAEQPNMTGRWRVIPYQAVGKQGILFGFRLDQISLQYSHTTKTMKNTIVALAPQKFSADDQYQGLISPDFF